MSTPYYEIDIIDNGQTVSTVSNDVETDVTVVDLCLRIDRNELERIAGLFNAESSSSPLAADSRAIARPIVEKWVEVNS